MCSFFSFAWAIGSLYFCDNCTVLFSLPFVPDCKQCLLWNTCFSVTYQNKTMTLQSANSWFTNWCSDTPCRLFWFVCVYVCCVFCFNSNNPFIKCTVLDSQVFNWLLGSERCLHCLVGGAGGEFFVCFGVRIFVNLLLLNETNKSRCGKVVMATLIYLSFLR